MKILVIGPSPIRSKGGMATVIEEIVKDKKLNEEFEIDVYESYIDGNKLKFSCFLCFHLFDSILRNEIMIFIISMQLHMVVHSEKVCMFMPRKSGAKK